MLPAFRARNSSLSGGTRAPRTSRAACSAWTGLPSSAEFNIALPQAAGHEAATPDRHRNALRLCRRMDRAIARRGAAAESSRLRCRHAVRRGNSGEQRRGRTADPARRWRAWPTAASSWSGPTSGRDERIRAQRLRARHHEKRRGVSRQYDPRAASISNGGRTAQRKLRDRLARALGGAAARAPSDVQSERRTNRRRTDHERST